MKIIARIPCNINGKYYNTGDEIKVNNKEQLSKLNEIGFIEPLTPKEIQEFKKEENKEVKRWE